MDTSASRHATAVDAEPLYLFGDAVWRPHEPGFADMVAAAHAQLQRPRCRCQPDGVAMYIAHLGNGFIVKRMPNSGHLHAPDCASYEPPPALSGQAAVAAAIREDVHTGCTRVRVDFALSQRSGRRGAPAAGEPRGSVRSPGTRLSLRGLLHYLWQQAELNRWHPGFAGRRHWGTVRRHLLQAAEGTTVGGESLARRLFVPEVFTVEQREALAQRRRRQWAPALPQPGPPQPLLLLLGEVKALVPTRWGHQAVIKHLPDQALALDAALARRLMRRFAGDLAAWDADQGLRLILLATAALSEVGVPSAVEVTLMLTTTHWLPLDGAGEAPLLHALVQQGRRFSKPLRYQLGAGHALPSAVLADTGAVPTPLYMLPTDTSGCRVPDDPAAWCWSPLDSCLPALPPVTPIRANQPRTERPMTEGMSLEHRVAN